MREYKTTDFQLACYLKYLDYRVLRLEGEDGLKTFVFSVPEADGNSTGQNGIEQDVLDFFNNDAQVAPLDYSGVVRDMRNLLRNVPARA